MPCVEFTTAFVAHTDSRPFLAHSQRDRGDEREFQKMLNCALGTAEAEWTAMAPCFSEDKSRRRDGDAGFP
jgi:hypothetical protein